MKLESKKVIVNKTVEDVHIFLCDVKNFEQLMPENTSKFEVLSEKSFLFALKGMPEIALELKESSNPNEVVFGAISDKLPFTLRATINTISENSSEAQLHFEGDFNAMMAMMIKSPITKFIETLIANLALV